MKVLHTSDWHLGRTIQRHQRLDEMAAVLEEIVGIAKDESVDLVLICGDVYGSFAPSAEAERLLHDTLLELWREGIPVVLVAGNHDYARRLVAVQGLLKAINIHVCAEPLAADQGGMLEISARSGDEVAQVAVLPWVGERRVFGAVEMMGLQGEPYQAYAQQIPALLKALCAGFEVDKVNILAGHLFISGSRPAGGERELTIGEIFAISAASLPTTAQYIALGHVHRPQDVRGVSVPTRYCGSPLQMDFGEAGQKKSVTLVELHPGQPAHVKELPLTRGGQLLNVEVSLSQLDTVEIDDQAYLRVFLECDGPAPGLVDRVREVLPNVIEVRLVYEREEAGTDLAKLKAMTPAEQFESYYRERYGRKPDKRIQKLFDELLEESDQCAQLKSSSRA